MESDVPTRKRPSRVSWGIRTRDLVAVSVLTLVVLTVTTSVYLLRLSRVVVEDCLHRGELLGHEVVALARNALTRPGARDPESALRRSRDLRTLLDTHIGYSDDLVYAVLVGADGEVLVSLPGDRVPEEHPPLEALLGRGPFERLHALYEPGVLYESRLSLTLDDRPFATLRLGVANTLIRGKLHSALIDFLRIAGVALVFSWIVALALAQLTLRPLRRLRIQVDKLRRGELDLDSEAGSGLTAEFGELASELSLLGREIRSRRLELLSRKTSLESMANQLQDGVILLNRDREVLFFNPPCAGLLSTDLEAAYGRPLDDLLPSDHLLLALLDRAEDGESELRTRISLGADMSRENLASIFPIEDPESGNGGWMVLLEDLEMLATLQSLIRYGARMTSMTRFAAAAGHEIKNPLNALSLQLELLRTQLSDPTPKVREILATLRRKIGTLDRRVHELLDIARPRELTLIKLDLTELLRRVAEDARAAADARAVHIVLELPDAPLWVDGDAERLEQVFDNLTRNALEAMPQGGELSLAAETTEPLFATATVTDSGVGIPPENLDKIFQPYFTTRQSGHGLGLFLVFSIVQRHGGMIEVTSAPGEGTQFTVRLPLYGVLAPVAEMEIKSAEIESAESRAAPLPAVGKGAS